MTRVDWKSVASICLLSVVIILSTGLWSYRASCTARKPTGDREDRECPSFAEWIDQGPLTTKSFLTGFVSGATFGLVDNLILVAGMTQFDSLFKAYLPWGDEPLIASGYGNIYSSMVSSFSSAFISHAVSTSLKVDMADVPLWAASLGFVFGGLIGVWGPRLVMKPK